MSDRYFFVAPFYQRLSQVVFGKDLLEANRIFLGKGKTSLIIGGGDGLAYRDFRENLKGEFWDLSEGMTRLARKNLKGSSLSVHIGTWPGFGKFDQVYFPFVLDTMSDAEVQTLLSQIKEALNPGGEVIVSDFFAPVTWGQKVTQKVMILFFRVFTRHQRMDLPDISSLCKKAGFSLIQENFWRKGWIRAQRWRLD